MEKIIKQIKNARLFHPVEDTYVVLFSQADIKLMLPHRDPMLLIDKIVAVDLAGERICAHREISGNDPVFKGHFPGNPVYPGALQLEMAGQTGLCLAYFAKTGSVRINKDNPVLNVRIIKVHHAAYLHPLLPEDTAVIEAKNIYSDDLTGLIAGQVCAGGRICSNYILEVYFVE